MKKKNKQILSFILALLLIIPTIFTSNINANAATSPYVKSLKVNTSNINLISGEHTTVKVTVKTKGNISKSIKIKISKADKKCINVKLGKPNKKGVSKLMITAKNVSKLQTASIKVTTKAKNIKQKKFSKTLKVTVTPKETSSAPISSETPVLPTAPVKPEFPEVIPGESDNAEDITTPESTENAAETDDTEISGDMEDLEDEESEEVEDSEDKDTSEEVEDSEDKDTSEEVEDSEDKDTSEEVEDSEDKDTSEDAEDSEDKDTSEDVEASEDKDASEDVEASEDKDASEDIENSGDEGAEDVEDAEDKKSEDAENTENPIPYEPNSDPYIPDTNPKEEENPILVSELLLDKDNIELESADKVKLTATILPENADNTEIIWSSKDESVAKVDQNGEVTAIAPGSTEIFVSTLDQTHTAVCHVTVILMPESVKATISKEEMLIGETAVISASVVPANATHTDIQYTSNNPEIAYVSSLGVVTAISPGEATIIAESENQKQTKVQIHVNELDATGISLNTDRMDLQVGDTASLTASLYPENATTKEIEWHSLNEEVAIVNENGVIHALSSGSALIRAYIKELDLDALCRVVVWRDDYVNTVTLDVMDDYTDHGGNVFHNTKLFHETMKVKVGVFKGAEPQTYMPVELSLDENYRYGNAPDYFELSNPYIITDGTGYGYVEIKLKDAYKESNALSGLYQSYVLHATETYSKKTASIDVRFASVERNGIVVEKDTITPSSNLKNTDSGISTTISPDGTNIEYVYNQQASYYEEGNDKNEHPVILSATPYIVMPVTRDYVQQEAYELALFQETMKSDTISNEVTNEILKGYVGVVSGNIQDLNIELGKELIENYKKVEIALVDCKTGEVIDSKIIHATETETMPNSVTLKNMERSECYIVISGISVKGLEVNPAITELDSEEGNLSTDTNFLVKITGVQTLSNNEITIKKELEDAVTWTLVSKEMGESYQSFGMTFEEVKKYVAPDDMIYLEEEMTYTCRIPLAPYVGNAIIEAVNPTNGKTLYWAYPTVYKDGTIQLAQPSETIHAFRISANEAFDTTGDIVIEGDTAIVDSTKVGFSSIKASFDIPGIDEWNKDNAGELYTYIQWVPMEYVSADM